jgi:hypothetical protein
VGRSARHAARHGTRCPLSDTLSGRGARRQPLASDWQAGARAARSLEPCRVGRQVAECIALRYNVSVDAGRSRRPWTAWPTRPDARWPANRYSPPCGGAASDCWTAHGKAFGGEEIIALGTGAVVIDVRMLVRILCSPKRISRLVEIARPGREAAGRRCQSAALLDAPALYAGVPPRGVLP